MTNTIAVLLDTVSIQSYVFNSNRLGENLGASALVQEIFASFLMQALNDVFKRDFPLDQWRTYPDKISLLSEDTPFEIGYIGGGNALLLFRDQGQATAWVKAWTCLLLVKAPGLKTAVAIGSLSLDEYFQEDLKKLHKQLRTNKAEFIPQTTVPSHGFTAECAYSGLSAEVWLDKKKEWVSSSSHAKWTQAAEKVGSGLPDELQEQVLAILGEQWSFTQDLEKLGQQKYSDNHIAIVHIDGNNMGKRFQDQSSLASIRKLSSAVQKATCDAFTITLTELLKVSSELENELAIEPDKQTGRKPLPLRPIILGGDDITFVTEGHLGIYLAQIYMDAFAKQDIGDGLPLSSCAGIAITKTKYPFFRGYALAEELCKSAKKKAKEAKQDSWLDFQLAYSGIMSSLDELRTNHFKAPQGNLLRRPYHLEKSTDLYSLGILLKNTAQLWLDSKKKWPASKIKELREVLTLGKDESQSFMNAQKALARKLPVLPGEANLENTLFTDSTPYLDMIEIRDLYPEFVLKTYIESEQS